MALIKRRLRRMPLNRLRAMAEAVGLQAAKKNTLIERLCQVPEAEAQRFLSAEDWENCCPKRALESRGKLRGIHLRLSPAQFEALQDLCKPGETLTETAKQLIIEGIASRV